MNTVEKDHAGAKSTQANEAVGIAMIHAASHVERGARSPVHGEVEIHCLVLEIKGSQAKWR